MRIICLSQKCTRSQSASLLTIWERPESKFIGQAACGESARPPPARALFLPSLARAARPAPYVPGRQPVFLQLTDAVRPVSRRRRNGVLVSRFTRPLPAHLSSQSRDVAHIASDHRSIYLCNFKQIPGVLWRLFVYCAVNCCEAGSPRERGRFRVPCRRRRQCLCGVSAQA